MMDFLYILKYILYVLFRVFNFCLGQLYFFIPIMFFGGKLDKYSNNIKK